MDENPYESPRIPSDEPEAQEPPARMKTDRPSRSTAPAIIGTLIVLALPLGFYVGCYYGMGSCYRPSMGNGYVRAYTSKWLADVFRPAAIIESAIRGEVVETIFIDNPSILSAAKLRQEAIEEKA